MTGFPTLLLPTIPGLFQDFLGPGRIIFLFGDCGCLNIKKKNGIYLQRSECSSSQKVQHKAKNVDVSCPEFRRTTQTGCYTTAEPLEKCMTFNYTFTKLSRTLSFKFQDFPGPKWFSRTFQVLELSRKNPRLSRRCGNPGMMRIHRVSKKLCQLIFCSFSVKYEQISIKIGRIVPEETLHPTQRLRFGGSLADIVRFTNLLTYLLTYKTVSRMSTSPKVCACTTLGNSKCQIEPSTQ